MRTLLTGSYKSGKTRTLIDTYMQCVTTGTARPDEILVFAMNETELQHTITQRLADTPFTGFSELWINKYTSFCRKILKKYFWLAGVPPDFEVLCGFEERLIMHSVVSNPSLSLEYFESVKLFPGCIKAFVDLMDIIKLDEEHFRASSVNHETVLAAKKRDLLTLYDAYQHTLKQKTLFDYRGLALQTLHFWDTHPDVFKQFAQQFTYLLIDDAEEITPLELQLVTRLIRHIPHCMCTANPSGTIYHFRGADPHTTIPSLVHTCALTTTSIEYPRNQPNTTFSIFSSEKEEVTWIGRTIRDLVMHHGYDFNDIVIIRRDWEHSVGLYREVFERCDIPFVVHGLGGILSHPIAVTLIGILKTINLVREKKYSAIQPEWLRDAFVSSPSCNVPYHDMQHVLHHAEKTEMPLYTFIHKVLHDRALAGTELPSSRDHRHAPVLSNDFFETAQTIITTLDELATKSADLPVHELAYIFLEKFGWWHASLADEKLFNILNGLYTILEDFSHIEQRINSKQCTLADCIRYLDEMITSYTYDKAREEDDEHSVHIMTVQQTKGISYPVVFFAGLAEGILPRRYRENAVCSGTERAALGIAGIHTAEKFLEQEMHIFECGISRADKKLFCSCAEQYGIQRNCTPSSFLTMKHVVCDDDIEHAQQQITTHNILYGFDHNPLMVQTEDEARYYRIKHSAEQITPPTTISHDEVRKLRTHVTNILHTLPLSASKIKQFQACPFSFVWQTLIGIKTPSGSNAVFGTMVHDILQKLHEQYPNASSIHDPRILADMESIVEKIAPKHKRGFESTGEWKYFVSKAHRVVATYLDDIRMHDDWEIVRQEFPFSIALYGHTFNGRIDRIDEQRDKAVDIIDYKTGKPFALTAKGLRTMIVDKNEDFQLVVYYHAAHTLFPNVQSLSYYWLEKETRGGKKISFAIDDEEIAKIFSDGSEQLKKVVANMEHGEFVHKPQHCRRCSLAVLCTLNQENDEESSDV